MIKEVEIKGFKGIHHIRLACHDRFNILIGENSIGKTSIFEAIHLWKICYDKNTKKDRKGFYSKPKNIIFRELEYLRVYTDSELFSKNLKPKPKSLEVSLKIEYLGEIFKLGFKISKVTSIEDAYMQIDYLDKEEFTRFSKLIDREDRFNLGNIIVINESKPISNIVVREPYMYRAQVIDKISKGKGYEVLRNKIIKSEASITKIGSHLSNVFQKDIRITETDKENKTYINLNVNDVNILSHGSGFLQVAEIFSSIEYIDAGIFVILIDEPDSHLHANVLRNLIKEMRSIESGQIFVISHNERFLSEVEEDEIRFIAKDTIANVDINQLGTGQKGLIVRNLVGSLTEIEKLKYAKKIVLLEGKDDKKNLEKIINKYLEFESVDLSNTYIGVLHGVDSLSVKLLTYGKILEDNTEEDPEWIVVRDSDCFPKSVHKKIEESDLVTLETKHKKIHFQVGYEFESTFFSDFDRLTSILVSHYRLDSSTTSDIKSIVLFETDILFNDLLRSTTEFNKQLEKNFNRQKSARCAKVMKNIDFRDFLQEYGMNDIQYLMPKSVIDHLLNKLHENINHHFRSSSVCLKHDTILDAYISQIKRVEDFYECHLEIVDAIKM